MPVAIRIPLTGLLVGGSTGVRIATGLATLAMTCGSLDRCAFAETPCGNEQGTARIVREAGPYHFRRTCMQVGRFLIPGCKMINFPCYFPVCSL